MSYHPGAAFPFGPIAVGGKSGTIGNSNRGGGESGGGRPHSIDAEFLLRLEQMGVTAQSMPYAGAGGSSNTFAGKTSHAAAR